MALLEHSDRICQISFMRVPSSRYFEKVSEAMQEPFLELTDLVLWSHHHKTIPALPDSFLGGHAPRLRNLSLDTILFPGLPKLLLSTTHLVSLYLRNIPHSGYIPPEEMVTVLSTLTGLRSLHLLFQSSRSRPDLSGRHPSSSTRFSLPALTELRFRGVSDYLEEFVARIDAPQLSTLDITFFNQIIFHTLQLVQFTRRTPGLKVFEKAHAVFGHDAARITLSSQTSGNREFIVDFLCRESDQQLSSLKQVCTSLTTLSTLEDLYIYEELHSQLDWQDNIEAMQWLELLHLFTAVKDLYLSRQFAPRVAPALQEPVGDRTTEVLPALQNIFLEGLQSSGPVQEGIGRFVAARRVTSHPIAVTCWERNEEDEG